MKLKSLKCPNCGAHINYLEDELDIFFCKYCKSKIIIEGQSDAAYSSKSKVKQMKHEETMRDKAYEHEKYKMSREDKNSNHALKILLIVMVVCIGILFFMDIYGEISKKKQELELQAIVDEIMVDIENEDFDNAYVKANTLYWDSSYSSEEEEKWEATRESVLEQIEEAEKEAEKEKDGPGFFDWFD